MKTIEESVEVEFPIAKIAGEPAGEDRTLKVAFEPHGLVPAAYAAFARNSACRQARLADPKARMTCPTTIRTSSSS